jgi:hypothetical protein
MNRRVGSISQMEMVAEIGCGSLQREPTQPTEAATLDRKSGEPERLSEFVKRPAVPISNLRKVSRHPKKGAPALISNPKPVYSVRRRFRQKAVPRVNRFLAGSCPVVWAYKRARTVSPLSGVPLDPCHKSGIHDHPAAAGFSRVPTVLPWVAKQPRNTYKPKQ